MKIEQRGKSFRVRKMIAGKSICITFDHKPTKKEVGEAFTDHISNPSNYALKGTFKDYADKYMTVKDKVLSPATKRSYITIINNLPQWFTGIPLKQLDRSNVQQVINELSEKHSAKTCRNYHGFISGVLTMYKPDLVLNTTLPQKVRYDGYVPTPAEVNAVLEASKGSKYWICFKLGIYSLRRSEICALEWPTDFEGRTIHVTKAMVKGEDKVWHIKATKNTGSTRDVVISQEMLDRIKEQGYIFQGSPDKILLNLNKYQKLAGVPHFRFHDLRAYFATEMSKLMPEADWLAMGGWSTPYVAKEVYRKSRITQNKNIQLTASDKLEALE